ncbi:2-oxoglutarate dehydrogenase complex dihydrolipoyllysine-residue succinyltransferase [Blastomonas sp. CCH8-A3]|uniref:2-oxoglutarate dehydrogenase complex dihydrolipoyllysine-residue succinyltransferase n=1 Tax=Blastomonas sp. CCH8-A3 TaxID=1768743 RepID=UPI0008259E60|nr:2-oxoglutarate dehydrogenase complex dihydrolipoyllysine-residue succinyltransferase [Blastomonas sp. CCH8-A3]
MSIEVKVPVLGESISEATIGEWLKKPGDTVAAAAGVLGQLIFSEGDTVQVGSILTTIESSGAAVATAAAAPQPAIAKSEATPAPAAVAAPAPAPTGEPVSLSPAVRRLVLEHGLDPTSIKGTGKDGRLTKEDVLAAAAEAAKAAPAPVAAAPAAAPVASGAAGRETERVRMTRIRQTIAKRLKSAQDTAAMLTTFNDVDMTAVMEARNTYKDLFEKKHGVRLGFMGFFAKAACLALKDVPSVNAQIEGDEIVYHNYADISVAVSAPNGLVVPVIRNAESLSFAGIEKTIADFGKRAKDGTLKMEEMQGGTFTISNGGVFGSLMSTPIINPPQSAVLGLHRIDQRPVVMPDGSIAARPMMYLALSYDHRLIDGREAVTFLKTIKEAIEDPTRLLIDL